MSEFGPKIALRRRQNIETRAKDIGHSPYYRVAGFSEIGAGSLVRRLSIKNQACPFILATRLRPSHCSSGTKACLERTGGCVFASLKNEGRERRTAHPVP
ncbi:MAG TPA: hypothetical protein VHW95_03795, partial [Steroidobacteraceae bacterium]|nr:hypothetical protein [Steroidobacteraceae bacterium]